MVWPLDCRWAISRSVKNACRVGARVLTSVLPGARPGAGRPAPSARARPTGTSYSEIGITGITPIPGLFRRPPLRALDGPGTWADALWLLSPAGIIRCVTCVDGTSSPAFGAHGDGAAAFVRTGGSIG